MGRTVVSYSLTSSQEQQSQQEVIARRCFYSSNLTQPGVVVLEEPVLLDSSEYGVLPELGLLDSMATRRGRQDVTFTLVGYGVQSIIPFEQHEFTRYRATSMLVNLRNALTGGYNLQTSNNPGKGRGGACYGDSGGPVFLEGTNIIVGITSFGLNATCTGVDFAYRTDTSTVQEFVAPFLDEDGL